MRCVLKKKKKKNLFKEGKEVSDCLAKQVIFKLKKNRIVEISKIFVILFIQLYVGLACISLAQGQTEMQEE